MGLAIAYWLLPTISALSHYCHVENQKSFFNIESKVIKDDKSKLLFSRKKRKRKEDSKKKKEACVTQEV